MPILVDFVRTAKAETAINSVNIDSHLIISEYLEFFANVLHYINTCFLNNDNSYLYLGLPKTGFSMYEHHYWFENGKLLYERDPDEEFTAMTVTCDLKHASIRTPS